MTLEAVTYCETATVNLNLKFTCEFHLQVQIHMSSHVKSTCEFDPCRVGQLKFKFHCENCTCMESITIRQDWPRIFKLARRFDRKSLLEA
jgi:hypothetical protein